MMYDQPLAVAPQASPWTLSTNGQFIEVTARLDNAEAVDKLIRVLEANKLLLPEKDDAKTDPGEPEGG